MKAARLALLSLLCALPAPALAQNATPGGPRNNFTRANGGGVMPSRGGHFHGNSNGAFPIYWDDRDTVVVEREIIREVPAAPPPPPEPPPPPRKPYVIGASYASLPGGCMKMVEAGGTYFYCSGDWYRQVGPGYKAVREP